MLLVWFGSKPLGDGSTILPLLTLLVVSEFSFFVTGIGTVIGSRHILSTGLKPVYAIITLLCLLLSLRFLWLGIELWPF